jgi:hypothetical protein
MSVDKLLGTVIKAAIAAIAVTAAAKVVAPAFARWQRKRELQREHARLQLELFREQEEQKLDRARIRFDEMIETANKIRQQVGLPPVGDGTSN